MSQRIGLNVFCLNAMLQPMRAARHRWFAWLMALAIALLPLHTSFAKPAPQPAAPVADLGDCHGKKPPDRPDLGGPACQHCGACHAVQTVAAEPLLLPGHVAEPVAPLLPIRQGTTPQPDLHPPLA